MRRLLGVLVLVAVACSAPSGAPPSSPAASPPERTVLSFQPQHHFLSFVMDGPRLVFSGGDELVQTSSPEIYAADPRTRAEELIVRATDMGASIRALASVNGNLVFAETSPAGPVIYRIRAHASNVDVLLDEVVVADGTEQQQYRATVVRPMVATDGATAIWVAGRIRDGQVAYDLRASQLDGSARRTLHSSREWIGYPRIGGDVVLFTQSLTSPTVWRVPLRGPATATLLASGHAEAAFYSGRVVTKFGGGGALGPGGITLWDEHGSQQELVPASALASEPSINERYVVWWGPTERVVAYDWRLREQVVLGDALRSADGKRGIVGRQVAFPGAVVWLASPPGDLTITANLKPYFQILYLN